jgi:hypothetical protein
MNKYKMSGMNIQGQTVLNDPGCYRFIDLHSTVYVAQYDIAVGNKVGIIYTAMPLPIAG